MNIKVKDLIEALELIQDKDIPVAIDGFMSFSINIARDLDGNKVLNIVKQVNSKTSID